MRVKILKPTQTVDIQYFGINSLDKHIGKVYNVIRKGHTHLAISINNYAIIIPSSCCQVIKPIVSKLK